MICLHTNLFILFGFGFRLSFVEASDWSDAPPVTIWQFYMNSFVANWQRDVISLRIRRINNKRNKSNCITSTARFTHRMQQSNWQAIYISAFVFDDRQLSNYHVEKNSVPTLYEASWTSTFMIFRLMMRDMCSKPNHFDFSVASTEIMHLRVSYPLAQIFRRR